MLSPWKIPDFLQAKTEGLFVSESIVIKAEIKGRGNLRLAPRSEQGAPGRGGWGHSTGLLSEGQTRPFPVSAAICAGSRPLLSLNLQQVALVGCEESQFPRKSQGSCGWR